MILVDTSVLIDFFRGVSNPKVKKFDKVLKNGIPFCITSLIFQEILQGAKDDVEFNRLRSYLETQTFAHVNNEINSYAEAAKMYFDLRRKGITVRSTIDCLIVQIAKENELSLLHNDKDYDQLLAGTKIKAY